MIPSVPSTPRQTTPSTVRTPFSVRSNSPRVLSADSQKLASLQAPPSTFSARSTCPAPLPPSARSRDSAVTAENVAHVSGSPDAASASPIPDIGEVAVKSLIPAAVPENSNEIAEMKADLTELRAYSTQLRSSIFAAADRDARLYQLLRDDIEGTRRRLKAKKQDRWMELAERKASRNFLTIPEFRKAFLTEL